MSSRPDQDFKWIFHMRDHFSKFSWAYPLVSKRASGVAEKLVDIFSLFGPPKYYSLIMAKNSLQL